MITHGTLLRRYSVLAVCGLWWCMSAQGQSGSEYPRTPWGGYPYPPSYDAEIADPDVHRVLFENENIMFLEVSNPPELDVRMHGHPYPSVFARDTGGGQNTAGIPLQETYLDPTSPFAGEGWGQGPAPPVCSFRVALPPRPRRRISRSITERYQCIFIVSSSDGWLAKTFGPIGRIGIRGC